MLNFNTNYPYKPPTSAFSAFKTKPQIQNAYSARTYRYHNNEKSSNKVKIYSALGGLAGALIPAMLLAKKQSTSLFKMHYGLKEMLSVSTGGIIGGTAAGVIFDKKQARRPKVKEGIFQFLNATIPMLTILPITEFIKNSKFNTPAAKLLGTAAGLFGGMVIAADISNRLIDPKDIEPDRKLNYKDALANMDDAVGALVLAKFPLIDKLPVEPLLPLIYAWCGYRAGQNN